jgi:outer membrane autotransporter protein
MHTFKHRPQRTPGRLTILAVAIASTVGAGLSNVAQADTTISEPSTDQHWISDNLTVTSTGSIGSIITPAFLGVYARGTVGTLNNNGSINALYGVYNENDGTIAAINNSGSINGNDRGIINRNLISSLSNSGIISGGSSGIDNQGTITSLNNAIGGSIISTSGNSLNNTGSIETLNNGGTIGNIYNDGLIGHIENSGTIDTTYNSANISGSDFGIRNQGTVTSLSNTGTISGASIGIYNPGTIASLNNSGIISGGYMGLRNGDTLTSLTNSSTLHGTVYGIYNDATITSLDNLADGVISGASNGIAGGGSIGTLNNSGLISGNVAVQSDNLIGTLSNSGTISGGDRGLYNGGSITSLSNSGVISGNNTGIHNNGTITSLSNTSDGTITGRYGIYNSSEATITTLSNSGTISGNVAQNGRGSPPIGIDNYGTIGTLENSGLITSTGYAIHNSSSGILNTITNSGTIAGTILNDSNRDLTINSPSDSTSLLTGYTGLQPIGNGFDLSQLANMGQITNTQSNLIFGSGVQLLNDHIDVGNFTVFNAAATLAVLNPITITGNYSQGAGASLLSGVLNNAVTNGTSTDSGYGRLVVSGSANVAAGSNISLLPAGYGFAQGQRYVVIQANTAGTNYHASNLNYAAAGYDVPNATVVGTSVVDGSKTNLLVTLGVTPPAAVIPPVVTPPVDTSPINRATTAGGIASLTGLYNYSGFNADLMNVFNAAAASNSVAAANKAGAQLSPTSNLSAATQGSTGSTVQVLNVTSAHIAGLRAAQGGVATGIATGEGPATSGLWGQAFGGTSRMDERDDIAGYHSRFNGMLIGADGMFSDSWRAGGLFSYTKTTVNNDGNNSGSSADVKSYGLFGYASYTGNPWYLDLSLGAIQHQYDTQRDVSFPGVNSTAKGSHDGMQYTAAAQVGYPIDLGSALAHTVLTPIAGLSYSTLHQDSYSEHGGAGTALHVSANNLNSLKSDLGTKLERSFATNYGSLVPSAQLTWRHEYREAGLQSAANFTADTAGATSFSSTGPKAVEDTGVLTVGLALVTRKDVTVSAHYTGEAGGGFTANTGDVQVRWEF